MRLVSPRTRNSVTPGISAEKVFGVDASYNLRIGDIKARVSGYYTKFMDQTKVLSYYDDVESTFSNFAMSGIDKRHFGLEVAASIPLYQGLSLNGAISWGRLLMIPIPTMYRYRITVAESKIKVRSTGKTSV